MAAQPKSIARKEARMSPIGARLIVNASKATPTASPISACCHRQAKAFTAPASVSVCSAMDSGKAEAQHVPEGFQAILPGDLFALGISAPEIRDADLINAQDARSSDVCGELDLETEIVAPQCQILEHLTPEHLVADLEVRQDLVVEDAEQGPSQLLHKVMMKIEAAVRPAMKA